MSFDGQIQSDTAAISLRSAAIDAAFRMPACRQTDDLTEAQASSAAALLIEDMKRHHAKHRAAIVCGPTEIDFSHPKFRQDARLLARILHRRGTLPETLRRLRTAEQAAAQAAALARAKLSLTARSRLRRAPTARAPRRRRTRIVQRTGRGGRKKRRSSDDHPAGGAGHTKRGAA